MYSKQYTLHYIRTHTQIEGKGFSEEAHPIYIMHIRYIEYHILCYIRAHTQIGGQGFTEDETPNYIIHVVYIELYILCDILTHPQIGGKGFTEEETPNYIGSFYSKTKATVEDLLKSYTNICVLRCVYVYMRIC